MKKKKVLFLEWASHGRDFEIILPLMFYFEDFLNWDVVSCSIFNPYEIIRQKPNLIIMSNITGAIENVNISKFIKNNTNTPLIAHVSEGFFRESELDEFLFGWAKNDALIYADLTLLWSNYAYKLVEKRYPEIIQKFEVSGSLSHDKYKNLSHRKVAQGDFSKVIGFAGFDFNNIIKNTNCGAQEYHIGKSKKINETLDYIIQENQDVLFILKPHPGDFGFEPLEFLGLNRHKNVLIVSGSERISDLINSSDIWICFNSGTTLEAWLLNKKTIVIHNEQSNFGYPGLHCNALANNKYELNSLIKEYYNTGYLKSFDERAFDRKDLIKNLIGFDDGLNHVRFIKHIKTYINRNVSFKYNFFSSGYVHVCISSFRYKFSIFLNNFFRIKTKRLYLYRLFSIDCIITAKKIFYDDYRFFHKKYRKEVQKIINQHTQSCN